MTDVLLGSSPNGMCVAAEALRRWPDMFVLYITGRPNLLAGLKMGRRQRILVKPFMPSYLVQVAREMMRPLATC